MSLTNLLIENMIIETLLDNLHEYIGEEQATMLKEIVEVNKLEEQEVDS